MAKVIIMGGGSGGVDTDQATATANDILKGKTAAVAGADELVEGTLEVQSVINFSVAQYSSLTPLVTWILPSTGPWSGLRIMCKQGTYPVDINDGVIFYEGGNTSAIKKLAAIGTWYFKAWNYVTTNFERIYGNYSVSSVTLSEIKGQQSFTTSGTFVVPSKVYTIDVFLVGGGSNGQGTGSSGSRYIGGGGGGGGYTNTYTISVTPGQQFAVAIGSGGNNSCFGSYYASGAGHSGIDTTAGMNGGSGGGQGGSGGGANCRDGGADGANGGTNYAEGKTGGYGQGRTTRAFGESGGTLYAGGGGGGNSNGYAGSGGAGGGANGSGTSNKPGKNGSVNTGGGGGGSGAASYCYAGDGGSGICLIRWG